VPKIANNALFCAIAMGWPLHSAQPFGAKLNATIRISPMNGVLIVRLP
jgi:hypothetical protein